VVLNPREDCGTGGCANGDREEWLTGADICGRKPGTVGGYLSNGILVTDIVCRNGLAFHVGGDGFVGGSGAILDDNGDDGDGKDDDDDTVQWILPRDG
jgi:hypothetical protein